MSAPNPLNERERLAALGQCLILDTTAEPAFDDITALAADICDTPIALVSLVDSERQWFKSRRGVGAHETPRSIAFCAHAILTPDQLFVVEDALDDVRFAQSPLVTGSMGVRFYAGVPLVTSERLALGALCVMDTRPRTLSDRQRDRLIRLSHQAASLLELRRALGLTSHARESAEAANRTKSAFLVNLSHEIRTPLTAILGFTDLLADSPSLDQSLTDNIQTIRRNGANLVRTLSDVLDMSRAQGGSLPMHVARARLDDVLARVANVAGPDAASKGLTLTTRREASAPAEFLTDPTRVTRILLNLVANAIRNTSKGSIQVIARGIDPTADWRGGVRIDVIDCGSGVSLQQTQTLFEPFGKPATGKATLAPAGLGLTIARELARAVGGEIEVDSTPSVGSRFTLRLDSVAIESEATPITPATNRPTPDSSASIDTLKSARVLVVDDGPDNRRLIGHFLRLAGARAEFAEDGATCVKRLTADASIEGSLRKISPVDIILMDVEMPVMDGLSATRALRSKGYAGPIIALTARASAADRTDCLAAGCDAFLTKPVDRHQLLQCCAGFVAAQQSVTKSETLAA